MTKSCKIDLENRIFFRAARLGVAVWSCAGALYCAAPDDCLRQLIGVYNDFFAEENRSAEDLGGENELWRGYARDYSVYCGLDGPVYPVDLVVEWGWLKWVNSVILS